MLVSSIISPGITGEDVPPGITALHFLPPTMPPAISSRSANGVPIGISNTPGLLTCPETDQTLTPPLLGTPRSANHWPPSRMIAGTDASVSALLTVVGRPYSPKFAGNGGLNRGRPFLPSS